MPIHPFELGERYILSRALATSTLIAERHAGRVGLHAITDDRESPFFRFGVSIDA